MKSYIYVVKKIIFLLALFMLLKPALPVLDYLVNYEYVAMVLCENKDKPKMHCNGKCHLMKELAKASENDKPISSDKKVASQESEVLFFQEFNAFNIGRIFSNAKQVYSSSYSNLYFHLESKNVFHPPIFIS